MSNLSTLSLLLNNLEGGAFHDEGTVALKKVIADLNDHRASHGGKPVGEITVKLKFTLDGDMMDIKPELAVKVPKVSRGRSVYFVTPDNALSRQDPRQTEMDLASQRFAERKPQVYGGSAVPALA